MSTLYIRNLNERVSVNTLKRELTNVLENEHLLPVLSITAHKNLKMKGQAFIAFEDESKCGKCLETLQKKVECGWKFLDTVPEFSIAKKESDAVLQKRLEKSEYEKYLETRKEAKKKRQLIEDQNQEKKQANKKRKTSKESANNDFANTPPNKVLLIKDLPDDVEESDILKIFGSLTGFVQVRLIKIRNVCFVEFEQEKDAIAAKDSHRSIEIGHTKVSVNFAKK